MAINLQVTHADALGAIKDVELRKLIEMKEGPADKLTGLKTLVPKVTIQPEPETESKVRTITWHMNMLVSVSEEGTREKFQRVVEALIRAANGLGGMIATGAGLVPANAETAVGLAVQTIGKIEDILDHTQADRRIEIDDLKVKIANRNGQSVRLKAKLAIDARWATDDPSDTSNKAWVEVEKLKIGAGTDFRPSPVNFSENDWKPEGGFPGGSHTGRSFMVPGSSRDRVGAMLTQNSSTPSAWLLEGETRVDRDETTINALSTVSAVTWNDTVIVEIKRIILELIVDDTPTDTETALSDVDEKISTFQEQAKAWRTALEGTGDPTLREIFYSYLLNAEATLDGLKRYRDDLRSRMEDR